MSDTTKHLADHVIATFAASAATKQAAGPAIAEAVARAARLVAASYAAGGRLYVFGNGGSAADAQHLAGELVGRYRASRRPLAAVALSTDTSALTCIANDFAYEEVFARQVAALAGPTDVVIGITTSGRSPNVVAGLRAAREVSAKTVAFTGGDGGDVVAVADVAIVVPASETSRIQECHLTALHALTELIEQLVLGI